jgi:hypothetical protein
MGVGEGLKVPKNAAARRQPTGGEGGRLSQYPALPLGVLVPLLAAKSRGDAGDECAHEHR